MIDSTPRLILYLPKLALYEAEVFELLCFSCGLDGSSSSSSSISSSSSSVSGSIEALFYIALTLRTSHLSHLSPLPAVNTLLSVDHNAVALLRWVATQYQSR